MFEIHEVTAAPHMPEALKSSVLPMRPENLFGLLAGAFEQDANIEVRLRDGEIFIGLTAADYRS